MAIRWKPVGAALVLAAGFTAVAPPPAVGQVPWANQDYRYRQPLTLRNTAGVALNAGDVVAYPFVPDYGDLEGKSLPTGGDVRIYYWNGTSNIDVPQVNLAMGASAAKILFSVAAPVAAGTAVPFVKGTDSSTFTETGTSLDLKADDALTLANLPFAFPYMGSSYNQIVVSSNGWLAFDTTLSTATDTHFGDATIRGTTDLILSRRLFIAPFAGDLDSSPYVTGADVFLDTSTAGQVTVRWKTDWFTDNSTRAPRLNFSVTLFQDGRIRFNYGNPNAITRGAFPPFAMTSGLAVGDTKVDLLDELAQPVDYTGHASVLFTPQPVTVEADGGYWLYFGNPDDTGARTPPADANLLKYTFDDGTTQGWVAASGNPETSGVTAATLSGTGFTGEEVLQLTPAANTSRPMAIAGGAPDLGNQTIFAKVRATGVGEVAAMGRASAAGEGYGVFVNGVNIDLSGDGTVDGPNAGILVRTSPNGTPPDYSIISPISAFNTTSVWVYEELAIRGTGSNIDIAGKAFTQGRAEPTGYQYRSNPVSAEMQFDTGKPGLTGWGGGSLGAGNVQYLDWMYVARNAVAGGMSYDLGGVEVLPPPPGYGTIRGVVTDAITTAPVPGVQVNITGPNTTSTITDALGGYFVYLPPGTYNVAFSSPGYTSQTQPATIAAAGGTATANAALVAPELAVNPSMETPDPAAPTIKPLGWFRHNYDTRNPEPNPTAVTAPWEYSTTEAHTGTRSVKVSGSLGIASWEPEGDVAFDGTASGFPQGQLKGASSDNRGNGPLIPMVDGATYRASVWVKKVGSSGSAVLRLRPDFGADDAGALDFTNAGLSPSLTADTGGQWVQMVQDIPGYGGHWLQTRLYGSSIPAAQAVYFDDVSVKRVQLPVFRIAVRDTAGNPLPAYMVGVNEAGKNGLADAIVSGDTDELGRIKLTFQPEPGKSYVVQAYPNEPVVNTHVLASPNVPLNITQVTTIEWDPFTVENIALGKPVVAVSSEGLDTNDNMTSILGINDDGNTSWYSDGTEPAGTNPRGYDKPQFFVIDMLQPIDFSKIAQIGLMGHTERPDHYQIRASNTAPDPNMDWTVAQNYGQLVYDSPQGAANRTINTPGYDAYTDIITPPSINPVTGRYVMFYADRYSGFNTQFAYYEFKIEVALGQIEGRVVDINGQPVVDALVGNFPDPISLTRTDAEGKYTLVTPVYPPPSFTAHKTDSPNTVYPVSDALTLVPPAYGTVTAPDIVLGPAVPNAVTAAASVTSDRPDLDDPAAPLSNLIDRNFNTQYTTQLIGDIPPAPVLDEANPLNITVDLGSAQQINTILPIWSPSLSPSYSISVSTNGTTWDTLYSTTAGNGGYVIPLGDTEVRGANPLTFPARSVRYIRITMTSHNSTEIGLWELQAALTANPPNSRRALAIVAGLQAATAADLAAMDKNGDGKITIEDVVLMN